jgi:ribonucleotide reductase alpha subunit
MQTYSKEDVRKAALSFFKGDQLATDVFVEKYALRNKNNEYLELTPADSNMRLAKEFARIESKYTNGLTVEEIYSFLSKLDDKLISSESTLDQLHDACIGYGSIIPQGSPQAAIGNPFQYQSLSNCFVIESPADSYGGILFTDQQQAQIMKRRGGVGFDISTIRPSGMHTTNAAKTTDGIGVFMERFSNTCREVAQGGRRGALMLSIDIRHNDIQTFINIKRDKSKVTGANLSIRVTDAFMNAVKNDTDFTLQWPVDVPVEQAIVTKIVRAKDIWDQIIDAAWYSAEPGVLFWDTIERNTPSEVYKDYGFKTVSTNPCLTGDVLVAVADGRNYVSIKQLADEGNDVPVYTQDNNGKTIIKMMRNPRMTGKKMPVYKVAIEGGYSFKATGNHKMILIDGTLKSVNNLQIGDQLCVAEHLIKTSNYNHCVVSIEQVGFEDVYNGTVDDTHRYFIGGLDENGEQIQILTKNCGEIVLSQSDSCRLSVMDLRTFVTNPWTIDAKFDYEKFDKHTQVAQRLMDDLVDLELEAVDKIIDKVLSDPEDESIKVIELDTWKKIKEAGAKGRRTGLGITGFADAMAMLGIRYGSEQSIDLTDKIYSQLALSSYRSSVKLAEERGAFSVFNYELEKDNEFINRIMSLDPDLKARWQKFGRRNIANTTTAPVGSLSTVLQCSSGIEPVFMLSYDRRRKVGNEVQHADYVDESGDRWQQYKVYHHGVAEWMKVTNKTDINQSPYFGATSSELDWQAGVKIQAAAQRWVCHSLSRTANLPKNVTHDTISSIYMNAWESGCKGFTVYRDGSRSGVLLTGKANTAWTDGIPTDELQKCITIARKSNVMSDSYMKFIASLETEVENRLHPQEQLATHSTSTCNSIVVVRPKKLQCDIHRMKVMTNGVNETYLALVGKLDDVPYEVFCGLAEHIDLPKRLTKGFIIKNGKKLGITTYNLSIPLEGNEGDEIVFKDIVNAFANPNYGAFTRTLSLALRHKIPIHIIVEQLLKDKNSDMTSFNRVISRVLKSYIKDGTKVTSSDKICPECKQESMIYQEGCLACTSCGYSKCG